MHSANNNKTQNWIRLTIHYVCWLARARHTAEKKHRNDRVHKNICIFFVFALALLFLKFSDAFSQKKHILFRKYQREKRAICVWRYSICFEFPVCSFIHARTLNFPRILDMEVSFENFFLAY